MLRDLKWLGLDWDEGIFLPAHSWLCNHGPGSRHLKHPYDISKHTLRDSDSAIHVAGSCANDCACNPWNKELSLCKASPKHSGQQKLLSCMMPF